MTTIRGILNFPNVFTAKVPKAGGDPKFGVGVLMPANDPQVPGLLAEVQQAKLNTFPSGYTGTNCCFDLYENKIPAAKEYHDPRFVGWYLFTCSAKADDRPAVVDMSRMPIADPAALYGGKVAYVSAGISGYTAGTGGIGGWLNGILLTDEEPPMGRLDNKPSVEQMFAGVAGGAAPVPIPATTAAPAPTPAPAPAPAPTAAPAALIMTAAANGVTYEAYMAKGAWTDEMLIAQGLAVKPSFA